MATSPTHATLTHTSSSEFHPTQEEPAPTAGTFANAKLPEDSQGIAVQRAIMPLPVNEALIFLGVKPDIKDMTLEEKFTCLKQCFAYGYGLRKVLCEIFESIRAEFKTYNKDRGDVPTVEEAFKERGLNYHTIYSGIRREKIRRAEDAEFFALVQAQQATGNVHGVAITDNDLPPVNTSVVVKGGRQAIVVTQGTADGGGKTVEVIYKDDSTSEIVKASDLVTLADLLAAKAAGAKDKNAKGTKEEADMARIAATAAKEDDALKSSDFYANQYFALVALINAAPKEMTPAEFTHTVNDNLHMAAAAMNAEEAKRLKPALPRFPSFKGPKGINTLISFLLVDAVGRPSPLKTIFGGLTQPEFAKKINIFVQRVCESLYKGEFEILLTDRAKDREEEHDDKPKPAGERTAGNKAAPMPPSPDEVKLPSLIGSETERTPHGYFARRVKSNQFDTPWHVYKDGVKSPVAFATNKQDAEFEVATQERQCMARIDSAKSAGAL